MDSEQRRLYRTMAVSGVIHLVVIGLLMAAPRFGHRSSMTAPIISVDLVSMPKSAGPPGPPAARPAAKKTAAKATPAKPPPAKKAVVIEKQPEISLKPAKKRAKSLPRKKVSLKEKTFKPPAVKKKAIKEMAREVEKTETQSRQAALDALAKKVATQEVARQSVQPSDAPAAAAGTGGEGGGVAGFRVSQAEGVYSYEAGQTIESNWAYSEQLAGGASDLEVLIGVKVLASGEIADVWFDKRSGNRYFDESARKAVLKSNPLPPFPPELRKSFFKFGLKFRPEGVF